MGVPIHPSPGPQPRFALLFAPPPQPSHPLGLDTGLRAVVPPWVLSTGHSPEASQTPALSALCPQLLARLLQPWATPPNPRALASSSVKGRSKMPTTGLGLRSVPRPAWSPQRRWVHLVGEAKGVQALLGGLRNRVDRGPVIQGAGGLPASASCASQHVCPSVPRSALHTVGTRQMHY